MSNKRHLMLRDRAVGNSFALVYSASVDKHKSDYEFYCAAQEELEMMRKFPTVVTCMFTTKIMSLCEEAPDTPWKKYTQGMREHFIIYPDVKTIHVFDNIGYHKDWFSDITKCIYTLNKNGIAYYVDYLDCPNYIDELQERFHILDNYFESLEARWSDVHDPCDLSDKFEVSDIQRILGEIE